MKKERRKAEGIIPSYKPMDITLIKRDKKRVDLRNDIGISSSTLAKMTNNEYIALDVIALICEYLDCRIEEVVEFISVEQVKPHGGIGGN
ncbi:MULTISPECIES: helix-turn-helix domain-containing protein [Peribacillus]|uniref:helix-turn-helix domain-containing protein n=1 Tax=Peribacillus TaxID=2675229 RepID=UPI001F4E08EF|nr:MULTISPECIES: helix-turn-helix transcriptional regulator [unclassified Peribacillus]MCK1985188.1 helix-turn-helix transcriptional regulator [Peribacillus sp. Aquil_B1]MCK2007162.1 helix-turn-helix transcriptional regulator [Peribacillus sp. Aquil_B8]